VIPGANVASETLINDQPEPQDQIGRPMVPRWHLHRRLYDWVIHWANTPYGTPALFILSFAESSFFPIPPDVLLAPLALGNRAKWFQFALACSVASVLGGVLGYIIGMTVWESLDQTVYAWHLPGINQHNFDKAADWYDRFNFWIVFAAGFTPLPYKVITISAGMLFKDQGWGPFAIFLVASTVSRSARFFLVAGLMGRYGPKVAPLLDKYFNLACVLFMILLIGGFAVIKWIA
jgi:membrane protein YqaA with SNARE-associated domain